MSEPIERIPIIDEMAMENLLRKFSEIMEKKSGKVPFSLSDEEPDPKEYAMWMPTIQTTTA